MNIKIRATNMALTRANSRYIRRRLISILSANKSDIDTVNVWLGNLSWRESETSKRCLIEVKLVDGGFVVSDNVEADLYVAIHRSVDRVGWKLSRCIGRRQARAANRNRADEARYNRFIGGYTRFAT